MEVQLSHSFAERIRAVDPECEDLDEASPALLLVSSRGIVVERSVADSWAKGTFANPVDSLERHFVKHGGGRTLSADERAFLEYFELLDEIRDEIRDALRGAW